jgi:hypothetical protein
VSDAETISAAEIETERERGVDELGEQHVRGVRTGHGANCSSIGSVIDTLFATAAVGSAVFAAVLAALKREDVTIAGGGPAGLVERPAAAKAAASEDP